MVATDLSVLVLQMPAVTDLDDYCVRYAAFLHPRFGQTFDRTFLRMRDHLEHLGVREFQSTIVVLQRDEVQPAWVSTVLGVQQEFISANAIEDLIAARRFLAQGDDTLLAATLRVSPQLRLLRESIFHDDTEVSFRLRSADTPLMPAFDCSDSSIRLVQQVNAAPTVADALSDLHMEGPDVARSPLLDGIRAAVLRGILHPLGRGLDGSESS